MYINQCRILCVGVWMLYSYTLGYSQDLTSIVVKGAVPRLVSSAFRFTEGPAADRTGNIYFTDQPNDRIMKWNTNGTIEVFMEKCGRSNGLYVDQAGDLLACADENNQLWKIDKNKKVTVLVHNFEGKRLNGPNDLWVTPQGGIYFTDPWYKRDYWKHETQEISQQRVYFFNPIQNKTIIVAEDLLQPNGIIGTPDGHTLYVADIKAKKTYEYKINPDGQLSDKKLFCDLGSDGMTVDRKGNVYLTGRGVTVYDKMGKLIGQIPIQEPWTANVTFGGKNRKTLFITASKSVYTLKMRVKGA